MHSLTFYSLCFRVRRRGTGEQEPMVYCWQGCYAAKLLLYTVNLTNREVKLKNMKNNLRETVLPRQPCSWSHWEEFDLGVMKQQLSNFNTHLLKVKSTKQASEDIWTFLKCAQLFLVIFSLGEQISIENTQQYWNSGPPKTWS